MPDVVGCCEARTTFKKKRDRKWHRICVVSKVAKPWEGSTVRTGKTSNPNSPFMHFFLELELARGVGWELSLDLDFDRVLN